MKKILYNMAQSVLFLVLEYIGDLLEGNLAALGGYKSKYKAAFVADYRADVSTTVDLPDAIARYARVKVERTELVKIKDVLLHHFLMLKGYINDAYPNETTIKSMTDSAGQQYYDKAQGCNWASVKSLSARALKFIGENEAELMAKENMPADFITRFEKIKTDYDTAFKSWKTKDVDSYTREFESFSLFPFAPRFAAKF